MGTPAAVTMAPSANAATKVSTYFIGFPFYCAQKRTLRDRTAPKAGDYTMVGNACRLLSPLNSRLKELSDAHHAETRGRAHRHPRIGVTSNHGAPGIPGH